MSLALMGLILVVRDWSAPPSWAAFRVTAALRSFCLWMADWLAPPPLLLAEKAASYSQSQVPQLKDELALLQTRGVPCLGTGHNKCLASRHILNAL